MDVRLTPKNEKIINQCLLEGQFRTPDEVISKALELLKNQRARKSKRAKSSQDLKAWAGCLASSSVLDGDSIEIQKNMRNEW